MLTNSIICSFVGIIQPLPQLAFAASSIQYESGKTLKQFIEKPEWVGLTGDKRTYSVTATETLEPDIVSIEWHNSLCYFMIYDAKYYNMQFGPGMLNRQPGIESITKQYLYQQAYKDFIDMTGISEVRNCFLLPTCEDEVINKGVVRLGMLEQFGLKPIEVRLLPAKEAYRHYLQGQRYDAGALDLYDNSSSAWMIKMAQEKHTVLRYPEARQYLGQVAEKNKK